LRHRAPAAWLLALLGASVCLWAAERALPPTAAVPGPVAAAAPGVSFADVTRAAGLASFRQASGTAAKDYIPEATGSGVAFVDFDDDGWLDAYLVNGSTFASLRSKEGSPSAALFHNNRDGTFTDVTAVAGVANHRWGQGTCVGDFDNDGWPDVYVTNLGPNRLYHNDGHGKFGDVAEAAGVTVGDWSTGCAFGDYDGDGKLDLFVAGYITLDLDRLPPAPTGAAAGREGDRRASSSGATRGSMGAAYRPDAAYCEYRGQPVMCGPRGLKGARDHLFRNNGDGTFTEVSEKAGVADPSGYYGFGVAFFDFDDDGRLDLFVANDSCPNYLYRNRGDGTFQDVSLASGAALNELGLEQAHMGVAVGDYDHDGKNDLHVTNFADDTNILYRNEGGGLFSDLTYASGVGQTSIPFLGWGTHFFDYDNDGWLDLFVANGHVYPLVDRFDWNTSYRQRALLFRNLGGKFVEIGGSGGPGLNALRSLRGSAAGDYDNDGDVDVLASAIDDVPALLRNEGGSRAGHWLTVRLVGDPARKCPRDAIGSVVFCTTNGMRQRGEVASGRSQLSQSDLRVHFGLGRATRVDRLEVRWANGPTVAYDTPAVDKELTIDQTRGLVPDAPRGSPSSTPTVTARGARRTGQVK
jgi:enediyne biosynthesis protein E4